MHVYNIYAYSFIYVCMWCFFTPFGDPSAASIWRRRGAIHLHHRLQFIPNIYLYNIYLFIYVFYVCIRLLSFFLFVAPLGNPGAASVWCWGEALHVYNRRGAENHPGGWTWWAVAGIPAEHRTDNPTVSWIYANICVYSNANMCIIWLIKDFKHSPGGWLRWAVAGLPAQYRVDHPTVRNIWCYMLLCVKRSTGHTHTHRQRTTPPISTHTHAHDKDDTPNPQTNTPHKHLTTLEAGATTVRATTHAWVGGIQQCVLCWLRIINILRWQGYQLKIVRIIPQWGKYRIVYCIMCVVQQCVHIHCMLYVCM